MQALMPIRGLKYLLGILLVLMILVLVIQGNEWYGSSNQKTNIEPMVPQPFAPSGEASIVTTKPIDRESGGFNSPAPSVEQKDVIEPKVPADQNMPFKHEVLCETSSGISQQQERMQQLLREFELTTTLENYHFKMQNGKERRIQRLTNEEDHWEIRFFTLDSEGLPEVWRPSAKDGKPETILKKWSAEAKDTELFSVQEGYNQKSAAQIRVELSNHKILRIEYISPQLVFACTDNNCFCH